MAVEAVGNFCRWGFNGIKVWHVRADGTVTNERLMRCLVTGFFVVSEFRRPAIRIGGLECTV